MTGALLFAGCGDPTTFVIGTYLFIRAIRERRHPNVWAVLAESLLLLGAGAVNLAMLDWGQGQIRANPGQDVAEVGRLILGVFEVGFGAMSMRVFLGTWRGFTSKADKRLLEWLTGIVNGLETGQIDADLEFVTKGMDHLDESNSHRWKGKFFGRIAMLVETVAPGRVYALTSSQLLIQILGKSSLNTSSRALIFLGDRPHKGLVEHRYYLNYISWELSSEFESS